MALILTSKKNINSIGHPDANNYGQQEKNDVIEHSGTPGLTDVNSDSFTRKQFPLHQWIRP